jgi:hypothetical protein
VTAKGDILLDERPIALADLEQSLKAVCRPETVVFYSRDNPERDSPIAADVIGRVYRLGLRYAIADPRANLTRLILVCWRGFREALLREEEGTLRQYCTEQVFAALKTEKRQAVLELCWEDLRAGKIASMSNSDQSAVMSRQLPKQPQAGNPEAPCEIEVRFRNSESHWRVAQIASTGLTVP